MNNIMENNKEKKAINILGALINQIKANDQNVLKNVLSMPILKDSDFKINVGLEVFKNNISNEPLRVIMEKEFGIILNEKEYEKLVSLSKLESSSLDRANIFEPKKSNSEVILRELILDYSRSKDTEVVSSDFLKKDFELEKIIEISHSYIEEKSSSLKELKDDLYRDNDYSLEKRDLITSKIRDVEDQLMNLNFIRNTSIKDYVLKTYPNAYLQSGHESTGYKVFSDNDAAIAQNLSGSINPLEIIKSPIEAWIKAAENVKDELIRDYNDKKELVDSIFHIDEINVNEFKNHNSKELLRQVDEHIVELKTLLGNKNQSPEEKERLSNGLLNYEVFKELMNKKIVMDKYPDAIIYQSKKTNNINVLSEKNISKAKVISKGDKKHKTNESAWGQAAINLVNPKKTELHKSLAL